jgi:Transposase DDE domain
MLSLLDLLALFCHVDDFYRRFEPSWRTMQLSCSTNKKRNRARSLSHSEVMTILIAFHQSHYRDFKTFYLAYVCRHLRSEFPSLVSYTRFMDYTASVAAPLFVYLNSIYGSCSGITFADSTDLSVCDNRRIHQHKVFKNIAKRGKTSTGWFFGFKLHVLVNDRGELLNMTMTTGDIDDRKPLFNLLRGVPGIHGKVVADKGYLSQELFEKLRNYSLQLITKARKNMKPKPMLLTDRLLIRKRAIIETIIDQLKNISQVEHTRHRSYTGFLWNVAAAIIAYCHQKKKPSLNLGQQTGLIPA